MRLRHNAISTLLKRVDDLWTAVNKVSHSINVVEIKTGQQEQGENDYGRKIKGNEKEKKKTLPGTARTYPSVMNGNDEAP